MSNLISFELNDGSFKHYVVLDMIASFVCDYQQCKITVHTVDGLTLTSNYQTEEQLETVENRLLERFNN